LFPSSHSVLTDLFRIAFRTFHYIFFLITTLSFCNSSPIYATPVYDTDKSNPDILKYINPQPE
jgi:hypothetical protein